MLSLFSKFPPTYDNAVKAICVGELFWACNLVFEYIVGHFQLLPKEYEAAVSPAMIPFAIFHAFSYYYMTKNAQEPQNVTWWTKINFWVNAVAMPVGLAIDIVHKFGIMDLSPEAGPGLADFEHGVYSCADWQLLHNLMYIPHMYALFPLWMGWTKSGEKKA